MPIIKRTNTDLCQGLKAKAQQLNTATECLLQYYNTLNTPFGFDWVQNGSILFFRLLI